MTKQYLPVVFDLDGTVRCAMHRLHLLPPLEDFDDPRAFDAMNGQCHLDAPIMDTIIVLRAMYAAGHPVVLLTRANEIAKEKTVKWLVQHSIPYHELIMAGYEDPRPDREYKEEKIAEIDEKYGGILAFWDDQPKVCEHIRALGYTCYHVTDPYGPLENISPNE